MYVCKFVVAVAQVFHSGALGREREVIRCYTQEEGRGKRRRRKKPYLGTLPFSWQGLQDR